MLSRTGGGGAKILLNLTTPDAALSVAEDEETGAVSVAEDEETGAVSVAEDEETGAVSVAIVGTLLAARAGFAYRLTTAVHEFTGEIAENIAELAGLWDTESIIIATCQALGPMTYTAPEEHPHVIDSELQHRVIEVD